ncbi:hypothetical protein GCM10011386_11500 [Parapedobacter defluvii]|uniref:FecR family protein n=1 Tax=Parapedobacter defluvii TaxID=2045106 RepID=A0ABQ1LCB2_9SPHI|nr:FecR domain-containing protein [Parapedobacter defluvii]GGC21246.1 hypothetical protein GCM10011386_11500 [Parapedobacter defluvii]
MRKKEAERLLEKYRQGLCSDEEKLLLIDWYRQWNEPGQEANLPAEELSRVEQEMWTHLTHVTQPRKVGFHWLKPAMKIAVAALVTIALSFSIYQYLYRTESPDVHELLAHDVEPGQNKALLALADGNAIELREDENGIVMAGGGAVNYADGSPLLEDNLQQPGEPRDYVLTTPRGGQYKVVLPDGSKVWLNAASSLRYPARFTGKERNVYLEGEAYFEVAAHVGAPFIVHSDKQSVRVLGTHFNVNAYADEQAVKTTLVEGMVQIENRTSNTVNQLRPGEQSVVVEGNTHVHAVETDEFIAWKEGYFLFNDTDLKSVMRQLARWYDVQVADIDRLPDNRYNGKLPRNVKLSSVLRVLELTSELKFEIQEGRRIRMVK